MPSLCASLSGQTRIKQARSNKRWAIEDTRWLTAASQALAPETDWSVAEYSKNRIFASGVSLSTWKRFLMGKPIRAEVFIAFCQVLGLEWGAVSDTPELSPEPLTWPISRCDWGDAPEVNTFLGRTAELNTLNQWLVQDRCRLVCILGMGGMGKTSLAVKLVEQVQSEFELVIWRSLLNAPPISDILTDWIKLLSHQHDMHPPVELEDQLTRLRELMQTQRCLLVLDNLETILMGTDQTIRYRSGSEEYGQLFKYLGSVTHQSCLLLTSREKPQEISLLDGRSRPVRSLSLQGLDSTHSQALFAEFGDFVGSAQEWQTLTQTYNGNPLALALTAKHIEAVFLGDLSQFIQTGRTVSRDLSELLDWHFDRLSPTEQEVVYWLAINREPVSFMLLKDDLVSSASKALLGDTLHTLQQRWNIQRVGDRFSLQPMLIEHITERLIERISNEILKCETVFFNQHALIKASATDYIRESQTYLILKPILERCTNAFNQAKHFEDHIKALLKKLQKQPFQVGYAAGNLLNMLCQFHQGQITDYDASGLAIWQAFLRDATLHNTRFAHAQFLNAEFLQVFGAIWSVAFSPDGTLLAAGSDRNIYIWRMSDRQLVCSLSGHVGWVLSVAFSPDGAWLVSSGQDQTLKGWDIKTGRCLKTLEGHQGNIRTVVFSPDGSQFASCSSDRTIRVWDVASWTCITTLEGHDHWIPGVVFSRDGRYLVSGSFDHTLKLWDVAQQRCLKTFGGHQDWIVCIALSPDGRQIASGSSDRTIKLWDIETGDCLNTLHSGAEILFSLSFSPDGTTLISSGRDGLLCHWDVNTGSLINTLIGQSRRVWASSFSPDGAILASGSEDSTICLWQMPQGQLLHTIKGYSDFVQAIAFDFTGQLLAVASESSTIHIWDAEHGRCLKMIKGHRSVIRSLVFSPDHTLATASDDGTIKLWNLSAGVCRHTLEGHTSWVTAIAFSPDGTLLASTGIDRTIRLWRVDDGVCLSTLTGHMNWVWAIAFHPNGHQLASAGDEHTLRLWDVSSGECTHILVSHKNRIWAIAYSPNGHLLASASADGTLCLWDAATGSCVRRLNGHTEAVRDLIFHPDGHQLVSSSHDGTVKLWNVATGECLGNMIPENLGAIERVEFNPSGSTLAISSDDQVLLWNFKTGERLHTLRNPRPYEGLDITGVKGLTHGQRSTLRTLGAIEYG